MRTSEVETLRKEMHKREEELRSQLEDNVTSAREALTDFLTRIEQEGIAKSDVLWFNATFGQYCNKVPNPHTYTDYTSRVGVYEMTLVVRGLLNGN